MSLTQLFFIFVLALFTSLIMIPPISNIAVKIGRMDVPDERKVHTSETPRLGGIAIFCAFLFSVLFFCDFSLKLKGFLTGSIIIFLTGLADDLNNLRPRHKLLGEILAATTAIAIGGIRLDSLGDLFGTGQVLLGPFAFPFTVLAIVGVMNAINLIDGLDGLAGGVSAIACMAFGTIAYKTGNVELLYLSAALLGAVVGFLRYNTYPAQIFMGDSGSLFLGYCMGFFSIFLVTEVPGVSPITPLMVLGVPILDTLVVMANRWRNGHKIFLPDKTHIHHRLLDLGIGHKLTVVLVYGLTYLLSAVAIFFCRSDDFFLAITLLFSIFALYTILNLLARNGWLQRMQILRSNQPIRETQGYRRIVEWSRYLLICIKYLLIGVLFLAAFTELSHFQEVAAICLVLFILFLLFLCTPKEWGNMYLQFALYVNGAFIIFLMENFGSHSTLFGLPLLFISNCLFFLLLVIEGAKIFLRNWAVTLISSPFEYLILFVVISVPLLPAEFTTRFHLLTVAGKSVIFFVAYKLILARQAKRNRKIILATSIVLLTFIIRSLHHL